VRSLKLYVRGAGATWGYTLDEAFQGTLAVRVRLGTGVEWCGEGPPVRRSRAGELGVQRPAQKRIRLKPKKYGRVPGSSESSRSR
jgi:hypothetical protein